MHDVMLKGEDYGVLKKAGLSVPIYGVFDSSCLIEKKTDLRRCVEHILTEGSGLVGVRTEPKEAQSAYHLGDYPHYMPLRSFEEVTEAIKRNESEQSQNRWWYLVNEAFLDYEWNAVVKLTEDGSLPGYLRLDGEVNVTDNLPLRPALANTANLVRANKWTGSDSGEVRKLILKSGLLETWLEISKVRTPERSRLVFWGMRGPAQK